MNMQKFLLSGHLEYKLDFSRQYYIFSDSSVW
jgi:hypothetical protein